MKDPEFRVDRILHAYVDNELGYDERRRTLLRIESDQRARHQVCDLRRTKEWVKFSFENEKAPTRTLPPGFSGRWRRGVVRVAASMVLVLGAFGAGWYGHLVQMPGAQLSATAVDAQERHVVLHIGESDEARFGALLLKARQVLEHYTATGAQVEVITNAGGLDMVRTASSHHVDTIKDMISDYENVRFIACSKGLERLQNQGEDVSLIPGVLSDGPAADHLIQRLTEGWDLIRI